jgi:cell fate regulator YaaT (PSP1 superfamily)
MTVAEIQFVPWDRAYWFSFQGHDLEIGDFVVVRTEIGLEIGSVIGFKDIDEEAKKREIKSITRKANLIDIEQYNAQRSKKHDAINMCRRIVEENNIDLKIVDAHFSFDGGRITFAFITNGRLDFRDLVKILTHAFQKSIRLHQLGVRDEAKYIGSCGPCGQELCCKRFLKELGQVNSELVEAQQIMHRGSERLSGMCGRLKCCLRFEYDGYCSLAKNLPAIGTRVRTDHGRGEIISQKILKQSVMVRLDTKNGEGQTVVEVEIKK